MTNIEKVKRILDAGHWVKVTYPHIKFSFPSIVTSYKDDAFSYIDEFNMKCINYSEECLKDCTIEAIQRIPTAYKSGDKVLVLSNPSPYDKDKEAMVGKVFEINSFHNGYYRVWTYDKSDWFYFPHHCLSPAFEEDSLSGKEAKVTIDGKEYSATLKLI